MPKKPNLPFLVFAVVMPQLAERKGKVGQLARQFLRLRGTGIDLESVHPKLNTFGQNVLRVVTTNKGEPLPNGNIGIASADRELLRGIAT
jgi:hypothetical protein